MVVKVKTLGIVFENEEKSGYCSGEVISGQVLVEVVEETKIKAVRMEVRGCAKVNLHDNPAVMHSTPSATSPCAEEVEYLHFWLKIREATGGERFITLPTGKHELPFSFQLPQGPLVTSFTGKYGSVQYWATAVLERPSLPDQSVRREFPVISHIDVNTPALLSPVSRNVEKMVGCWLFTSGPISLSAKIDRRGYCNGEAIPIYAEIENCSSRLIVPKAAIFQTQTFLARGKTKTFRQVIANVRGNHIASSSMDNWNGKTLKIPPVIPSILDCCIIRVEYSLAVYVHIPGSKKLMSELPLVIGTIPHNRFGSRNSSMCSQFSMDVGWLGLPEQPEAPPTYADVVSEEEFSRHVPTYPQPDELERDFDGPTFACIQRFRFQPPPLYSEVDPYPTRTEQT
ncbi:arrestin domain-containing protein 4 [Latimeria chalumnae]|uniref:Arrestin domain containing 4 n=1 Tax=Latimeria chalumnae TaxID=7897 RepID=H3ATH2_LATCH|nr:PREDICTED: arrestin domain-containing protein 4 [Latimeria chalumnae]|eukprot:XP_006004170.1 PREDICTED: arrestin domain-containing protein 4 [Latimeria chalumnae]